jgi:hypothetical protein
MQHLLWAYLSAIFDMLQLTDLFETFFAVDALQRLLILLTNGVHAARTEIDQVLLELGTCICTTGTVLAKLQSDFYAYYGTPCSTIISTANRFLDPAPSR